MNPGTGQPVWCSEVPASQLAIIVALELEAATCRRVAAQYGFRVFVSGPGLANARKASRRAIEAGARALISFGLAGGLGATADTGSVVLPREVISGDVRLALDAGWRDRVAIALGEAFTSIAAPLYTAEAVITQPADKAALASATGAAAVDMESAGIAAVAADAGLPCVVVRVVADAADDALPARVDELVTMAGGTRWRGLLRVLLSPAEFGALVTLARRSRVARQTLGAVAARLAGAAA